MNFKEPGMPTLKWDLGFKQVNNKNGRILITNFDNTYSGQQ